MFASCLLNRPSSWTTTNTLQLPTACTAVTTIYESPRQCRFKLVTYRGGCPDSDNSNDAAPAFNSTTALINFGSKRRVCVEFPGLGYTLIEESSCRPSN